MTEFNDGADEETIARMVEQQKEIERLTAELALFKTTNDSLRVAVDVGLIEIDSLEEKLDKFEQGYQGSCLACEPVGTLNLELTAEVTLLRKALDNLVVLKRHRDRHGKTHEYLEKKPVAWQQALDALVSGRENQGE